MNFFGNNDDPLTKTLNELQEHAKDSNLGNAGDFFTSVHERDTHTKPTNGKADPIEFNAASYEPLASNFLSVCVFVIFVSCDCFSNTFCFF